MNTSVVIVCAGNSTRMGGVNKILMPLGDRLVIGHTMLAFEHAPSVKEIIIVARESDFSAIETEAHSAGISKFKTCTAGGKTRQESVINGIRRISPDTELIAVHDGARPLVKPEHIEKAVKDASVSAELLSACLLRTQSRSLTADSLPILRRGIRFILHKPHRFSRKKSTSRALTLPLNTVLILRTTVSLQKL